MKKQKLAILAILLLAALGTTKAQETEKKFGIEFNAGGSYAIKKIEDKKLNPGFGFEGSVHYNFIKNLGVYAGWGWNRFGADDSFAGKDVCFEETGYILGLQFQNQISNSSFSYFAKGGALYSHIELENSNGDIILDTKHGFGYQAVVGVEYKLNSKWSLTPSIKLNSLKREADYEKITRDILHQYLSARIGIVKKF